MILPTLKNFIMNIRIVLILMAVVFCNCTNTNVTEQVNEVVDDTTSSTNKHIFIKNEIDKIKNKTN